MAEERRRVKNHHHHHHHHHHSTGNNNGDNTLSSRWAIQIENLRTNKDPWKLAKRIFRMLTSVGVVKSDIVSIVVEEGKGKASVHVRNQTVQDYALGVFADVRDVMSFFDVRKLATCPLALRLSKVGQQITIGDNHHDGFPRSPSLSAGSFPINNVVVHSSLPGRIDALSRERSTPDSLAPKADSTENVLSTMEDKQAQKAVAASVVAASENQPNNEITVETPSISTDSEAAAVNLEYHHLTEEEEESTATADGSNESPKYNPKLDVSTSVSGLPPTNCVCSEGKSKIPTDNAECSAANKALMVDVKTSTPQVSPCFCPETVFYHKNQHLGTETRHAEFKQGGVVFAFKRFRFLIGRYLCAFLNTEGGVIYFGVTDDGQAVGIRVDQKTEDQIRLVIDDAVSKIRPKVPTSEYSVNFAKVMGTDGKILRDVKVLEVCVHPRYSGTAPYSFDNQVYVRRDGSLRTI